MLDQLLIGAPQDRVTLKWLVAGLGDRSFGIIIILLALLALLPGVSTFVGVVLAVPAYQMIRARTAPAFPKQLAARPFSTPVLAKLLRRIVPVLRWLERFIHPRWPTPFESTRRVVGGAVLLMGTLLLVPVPLSNFVPAIIILVIAIAYLEEDGLLLCLGLSPVRSERSVVTSLAVTKLRAFPPPWPSTLRFARCSTPSRRRRRLRSGQRPRRSYWQLNKRRPRARRLTTASRRNSWTAGGFGPDGGERRGRCVCHATSRGHHRPGDEFRAQQAARRQERGRCRLSAQMCPTPGISGQSGTINMSGPIGTLTGDIVGGNKITYGLSAEELIAVLEKKGILATATNARLDRQTIVALAQRLNPDEALEFDQAIAELEHAVTVALDVIATGEPRRKRDEFVNIVLARVAQNTRLGDFDGGASAIDYGLAELDSAYPTQPVAKPA